nr:protein phosphatase 2C 29-like [Ipomoea batatas]
MELPAAKTQPIKALLPSFCKDKVLIVASGDEEQRQSNILDFHLMKGLLPVHSRFSLYLHEWPPIGKPKQDSWCPTEELLSSLSDAKSAISPLSPLLFTSDWFSSSWFALVSSCLKQALHHLREATFISADPSSNDETSHSNSKRDSSFEQNRLHGLHLCACALHFMNQLNQDLRIISNFFYDQSSNGALGWCFLGAENGVTGSKIPCNLCLLLSFVLVGESVRVHRSKYHIFGTGRPDTTYLVRVGRTSSNWSSGNSNLHHHRASANSKLRELCQMQTTGSVVNGFESTSSFCALPLQPIPRGGSGGERSCPMERAFFMSGPIERGALSGPLEPPTGSDSGANNVPFSAPLGGVYVKKKRRRGISGIRKALYRNFPE